MMKRYRSGRWNGGIKDVVKEDVHLNSRETRDSICHRNGSQIISLVSWSSHPKDAG
jgi:hypothetical protein